MQNEKLAMMEGEMDNLRQKIALLEQKLKDLEENRDIPKNRGWDVLPPPVGVPGDCVPYPIKRECPKCGLKMDGPIGYYCTNNPCPCGLGGVSC